MQDRPDSPVEGHPPSSIGREAAEITSAVGPPASDGGSVPTVAVVVPVYNRPELVVDAVESILAQRYPSLEVILVDDGSTDGRTSSVISALAARHESVEAILLDENGGQSAARNRGASAASAELLTFLDSDDLMPSDRISEQVEALLSTPDAVMATGRARIEIDEGIDVPPMVTTELAQGGDASSTMASIMRRRFFLSMGGFDETLRFGDDTDLLYRMAALGPVLHTDNVWVIRRIHGGNLVYDTEGVRAGLFQVLRRRRSRGDEAPTRFV